MIHPLPSNCDQLIAQSHQVTGINHVSDTEIVAPMERLLDTLNSEAELSLDGSKAMEQRLLRILCNRLRMLRDFDRHPEIEEQKIERPLFLTGAPRTGSTKLHKLLASSGDFQYLPFWRGHSLSLRTGNRDEDPAPRIEGADEYTRWFDRQAPDAKLIHSYETHEPEEETLLFDHSIANTYALSLAFVPSYIQWAWQPESFMESLRFMKQALKYLQWQFEHENPRRWVLKCPIYFGKEPQLAKLFPDADFVSTHRQPNKVVASTASLLNIYHQAYSDTKRKSTLGSMLLEGHRSNCEMFLKAREQHPELHTLDVCYTELVKSSGSVIERIYAHVEMPLGESAISAMTEWQRHNKQHKHGAHKYTLEEFSLSEEVINRSCSNYIQNYRSYF